MKKQFSILFFLVFLLVFIFSFEKPVSGIPSFEIYSINGTSFPTLRAYKCSEPDEDKDVVITADFFDVSGVISVKATIKAPSGKIMGSYPLRNESGNTWYEIFNTSDYKEEGAYTVDFVATDRLFNSSGDTYYNKTCFMVGTSTTGDWLTGWGYRKKITIDATNISSSLDSFPLYVRVFDDSEIGAVAQSSGWDIMFTADDGTTLLPYERESWAVSETNHVTADFWVKVPAISSSSNTDSSNTDMYVYYGNSSANTDWTQEGNPTNAENVWDSHYKAVYHLEEISGNKWADSTSNKNDGNNSGVTQTIGKVSGAGSFVASGDEIYHPTGDYITSVSNIRVSGDSQFTVEAWIYPGNNPGSVYYPADYGRSILSWGAEYTNGANFLYYNSSTTTFEIGFWGNDKIDSSPPGQGIYKNYPNSNWYYTVNSYDGTNNKMFVNADNALESVWMPGHLNVSDSQLKIGIDNFPDYYWGYQNQGRYYSGKIDEVRISDIARSADWIKFEYDNINATGHKINFNGEETN